MKLLLTLAAALLLTTLAPTPTSAQIQESAIAGFGPLDPAPPTGIAPADIITKFGAREAEFAQAREAYTFRQTVKVQTISDDTGKPDGEYNQITDIVFDSKTGKRTEHVVFAPQNSLERVMMTTEDFQDIEHRLPFILTTTDLPQYDVTYLGKQKVDDLETYVFDAKPKLLEKNKRYFQGKVWVDQRDLQIVLVNGKSVPDDKKKGQENLSPPYTTYYEQIDNKYWFPTYTKAEGELHFAGGNGYMSENVHLKTTVRYTDYKRFRATIRIIENGEDITNNQNDGSKPDNTPTTVTQPQKPPQ